MGKKEVLVATRSEGNVSLPDILQDNRVLKIMFDCRTDSDALYHQWGITLQNVLDCQVFDLGYRMHRKEYSRRDPRGRPTWRQGMSKVFRRLVPELEIQRQLRIFEEAPHKRDMHVWQKRPLSIR